MDRLLKTIAFLIIVAILLSAVGLAMVKTNTITPPVDAPSSVHRAYMTIMQDEGLVCPVSGIEHGVHQSFPVPYPGLADGDERVVRVYYHVQPIIEAMIEEKAPMTVEEAQRRWTLSQPDLEQNYGEENSQEGDP